MSEANIRQQIYTILSGVTDIGKVYDYERWAAEWGKFIELFKSSPHEQIRGWEIGRKAAAEQKIVIGIGSQSNEIAHTFYIRGYMALDDSKATEKTFNTLIEAVCTAFRNNKTLNSTAKDHDFIQVITIETRMFGGAHCHFAELNLIAYERI